MSYAQVNVAFDEESPVVKYARRSSLHSVKSLGSGGSVKNFPPAIEEEKNGRLIQNFRVPPPKQDTVVRVTHAFKRYGRSGPLVLKDFGMNVERGTIVSWDNCDLQLWCVSRYLVAYKLCYLHFPVQFVGLLRMWKDHGINIHLRNASPGQGIHLRVWKGTRKSRFRSSRKSGGV